MKKLSFVLAVALMLSANSFAEKREDKERRLNEARERSKNCHWVCEDGEMVIYDGNKKISPHSEIGTKNLNRECPLLSKQANIEGQKKSKNCKSKKGKRR
jgi:hypothetical protein